MFIFIRNWLARRQERLLRERIKAQSLRWVRTKLNPEVFGEKLHVPVSATVDLGAALAEAAARAEKRA